MRVIIWGILRRPSWESWDKMTFGCRPVAKHRKYYKGEGGGFPQVRNMVSIVSLCLPVARPCTKRCSNYALTNLLFSLCKSVWIIDLLVILPSPHPEALARPSTPKMLWTRECTPTLYLFVVFTLLTHNWVHQRVWGGVKS
jgi:hypothetical protein